MPSTTKLRAARSHDDRVLLERYHRTRDVGHRDELVERFMPLAHRLARRYRRGAEPLDDLTQVAAIGLTKAIERFDPSRGHAFSSYAVPTITGELKRHFRDHTWAVRPPRDLLERALRVKAATEQLSAEQGRSPTVPELCERLDGLDEQDVLEALHAGRAVSARSLDAPSGRGPDESDGRTLGDDIDAGYEELDHTEQRVVLDELMRVLDSRERDIVRMRFVEDMTQAQIGRVVGVSQMQVSRIVRRAVERMRIAADAQHMTLSP